MLKNIILIQFLSISAFAQTMSQEQQIINDWKKLDQSDYSIFYPSTWELNQSGQMGTSFILFSPLESDKDMFRENINLLTQDLSGLKIDINKYTEISEEQIKTMVTNAILIESKRVKNGKDEFHKIIYSGDQGTYQLQFEQYYWVVNNKAYVLTFTSEKNKFTDYKETGEKILNSFTLKN